MYNRPFEGAPGAHPNSDPLRAPRLDESLRMGERPTPERNGQTLPPESFEAVGRPVPLRSEMAMA